MQSSLQEQGQFTSKRGSLIEVKETPLHVEDAGEKSARRIRESLFLTGKTNTTQDTTNRTYREDVPAFSNLIHPFD
jgi:hypothetical protein